jgi:hypothetical protein
MGTLPAICRKYVMRRRPSFRGARCPIMMTPGNVLERSRRFSRRQTLNRNHWCPSNQQFSTYLQQPTLWGRFIFAERSSVTPNEDDVVTPIRPNKTGGMRPPFCTNLAAQITRLAALLRSRHLAVAALDDRRRPVRVGAGRSHCLQSASSARSACSDCR